jgi:solute carrier family 38 (sodium-coupled neutral amino acid transporter), member 11
LHVIKVDCSLQLQSGIQSTDISWLIIIINFTAMKLLPLALVATCAAAFASIKSSKMIKQSSTSNKAAFQLDKSALHKSFDTSLQAAAAVDSAPARKGGDATIAASTFNLAKCIIGAGVLSLPSGVAFFSDEPAALIPAAIITTVMGLVSAYTFSIIGKACETTNAKSFQDAWSKSVDPNSAWIISGGITATCFLASLAYSIIIGDSFTSLAKTFHLPAILAQRTNVILGMTAIALYPLCSMKSLSALAPFSVLGLGGTLYTAIFMAIRYFDKSYAVGGRFFKTLAAAGKPSFSARGGMTLSPTIFVLLSMLSTSFIAHFSAPTFYNELKDTSMPRFNRVVNSAFFSSIAMFIFVTAAGFLTFGGSTAGFVLNNYSGQDALATFARLCIGIAILTGYPFTFSALRDGILDLAKVPRESRGNYFMPLTLGLLGIVTGLALILKDVGFVVSVSGALFGNALMFVVPAIMHISNIRRKFKSSNTDMTSQAKLEVGFNYGLIGTGVVMGALGVVISVLKQLGKM